MEIELSNFKIDTGVGYMYCYCPNHILANKAGKVYEHRYVAWINNGNTLPEGCHVHHKDGNKLNNSVNNLEILTPEEHAKIHMGEKELYSAHCSFCGENFFHEKKREVKSLTGNLFCSTHCYSMSSRKFNVEKEELEHLVWRIPTTHIAKMFGVSDKAVEKRCKKFGITKPPRGYWSKNN